jgi:hypothetical protein
MNCYIIWVQQLNLEASPLLHDPLGALPMSHCRRRYSMAPRDVENILLHVAATTGHVVVVRDLLE